LKKEKDYKVVLWQKRFFQKLWQDFTPEFLFVEFARARLGQTLLKLKLAR
jgi:hypothetical protein